MTSLVPLALMSGVLGWGEGASSGPAPSNETIRREALRADLTFLAGDGFRGRLTATPENAIATDYVVSRLARLGLRPVGGGDALTYSYHLVTARAGEPATLELVRDGRTRRFRNGIDVYALRFSASGRATGKLAFAGFGIVAPGLGWDDYGDRDVGGRLVVVLDHEPGENDPASRFDGVVTSIHSDARRKAAEAQKRGAAGLLVVSDVHNHPGAENFERQAAAAWPSQPPRIDTYSLQSWYDEIQIPVVQISRVAAADLLQGAGRSLEELARQAEAGGGPQVLEIDAVRVSVSADVRRQIVPDRSVLAQLDGSDPELKNEYVIISAHHDHDGADGSQILNGADDNGTGTVGLIAIAEAYEAAARQGRRPRRSILFASFNSEERGLLGSWAFVEQPPVPLEKVVAVLNMDMLGRDEEVPEGGGPRFRGLPIQTAASNRDAFTLLGQSRSADLTAAIEHANESGGFGLRIKKEYDNNISNLIRRSDHWPFLQKGVPGVWFHTGLHPDYHTANDRPERIRYDKLERMVRLVHQASWELAESDRRPRLDPAR